MSNIIKYISHEEVLTIYETTLNKSGGGFAGVRDEGGIISVLDFVQNDLYYPDFISKLNYLVFRFCSGHFFNDGNKRIALTIGVYFLLHNGHYWAAAQFMKRMEAIIYHIAASHIDTTLSLQIMKYIVECGTFDEELQLKIMRAMEKGNIQIENT